MVIIRYGKVYHTPQREHRHPLAHLIIQGPEPVGGESLMSVMRGQCNTRPTFNFTAARHHRPLAGTKLVTEAYVC